MFKFDKICFVSFIALLFSLFISAVYPSLLFAAQETPTYSFTGLSLQAKSEAIKITSRYPSLSGVAGTRFEFELELAYQGEIARRFDILAKEPPGSGWYVSVRPVYPDIEIRSITLEPGQTFPERIKVVVDTRTWRLPEPGKYIISVEVSSGDLKDSIELEVVIIARYGLKLDTLTGRLDTKATAGEATSLSLLLSNVGTATLERINFTSTKPEGWSVTFNPDKVDSLPAGAVREIEVTIKPSRKAIAGDYRIFLDASDQLAFSELELRVTVLTPTIWLWVGVGIILVVIAGLALVFIRFGRR